MAISQIKAGSTNHNLIASNVAYGTCATAAATAAKVVSVSGGWELTAGAIVSVKFTNTNTAENPTLNVNSTGAKSIWYNTSLITTSSLSYAGYASRVAQYMYDGTNYVFQGWSYDTNSDTKVTQTVRTTNGGFPILLRGTSAGTTTTTTTASFAADVKVNPSTGSIYAEEFYRDGLASTRVFGTLIPYGTSIAADTNLNTPDLMKVGNYFCSANATVATLTNCPTTSAFMMQVLSPLSTTIDNETTKTWIYRLRKMQVYTGDEYVQYCYVGGTAGTWTYGAWEKTSRAEDISAITNTEIDGISFS